MISLPHIAHEHTHIEAERPYRPLLVVTPGDLNGSRLPEDPAIGLALRLEADDAQHCRKAIQGLITGDRPFLLLLDTPDKGLFEYVALSLFSPNYLRIGDTPVLAFYPSPSAVLIDWLQEQGFTGIIQWNTQPARWLTRPQQTAHIAGTLLSGAPAPKFIFIRGRDLDDTLRLEQGLQHSCQRILDDDPLLQTLMTRQAQLEKNADLLKKENNVLQERLHNTEVTIGIIRSKYKDDYDILFSWYQQEYEALPLWYKRFGQLIKVMTGKRTAKSLFQAFRSRLRRWTAASSTRRDRTVPVPRPHPNRKNDKT